MLPAKKNKIKKKFTIGKPFNPDFDGNLLAWYDGDTLNTDPAGTWSDRSGNGNTLTLFNAPTIISPAINGHDALRFDGVNQYANSPVFVRNQPHTVYFVLKTITAINKRQSDSLNNLTALLTDTNGGTEYTIYAGVGLTSIPVNVLNYEIITGVFNGLNSEIRINNNVATVGNAGAVNASGFRLACDGGGVPANFCNFESAYNIVRNGADNTATQNLFINWLKNRFAL